MVAVKSTKVPWRGSCFLVRLRFRMSRIGGGIVKRKRTTTNISWKETGKEREKRRKVNSWGKCMERERKRVKNRRILRNCPYSNTHRHAQTKKKAWLRSQRSGWEEESIVHFQIGVYCLFNISCSSTCARHFSNQKLKINTPRYFYHDSQRYTYKHASCTCVCEWVYEYQA